MIHTTSIKALRGRDIAATDGTLGDVHDVLFDDHDWKVRYLVIDTGNWMPGRRVLVAPDAVEGVHEESVAVALTKDEIKESPGIGADAPVSRQHEIALADHFRWPRYWEEFPSGVGMTAPMIPPMQPATPRRADLSSWEEDAIPRGDPNLRSAAEVTGYYVEARDGDIGHIDDLLVSDQDWSLRYLVVDTRNWLPGRKVLVAPAWTRGIDWSEEKLFVDTDRETIKGAPEYEPGMEIDREMERRIFAHYGHTPEGAS